MVGTSSKSSSLSLKNRFQLLVSSVLSGWKDRRTKKNEDEEETKGWSVGAATKQQRSQRANVRDRPA